ncbi:hypothetical protein [Streptomyces sp. LN325]|uniref:hypothetical protein n=1 Tax=Streptomyces sp. LN325 TaxID=3112976 RepID=UPI00370F976C
MGAVGSSADNAVAESFNAAFKRETLKGRKSWSNEREARLDAFRWLTRYPTPPLPPQPAIPDRLRARLARSSNYPGPSRIDVFNSAGKARDRANLAAPRGRSPEAWCCRRGEGR